MVDAVAMGEGAGESSKETEAEAEAEGNSNVDDVLLSTEVKGEDDAATARPSSGEMVDVSSVAEGTGKSMKEAEAEVKAEAETEVEAEAEAEGTADVDDVQGKGEEDAATAQPSSEGMVDVSLVAEGTGKSMKEAEAEAEGTADNVDGGEDAATLLSESSEAAGVKDDSETKGEAEEGRGVEVAAESQPNESLRRSSSVGTLATTQKKPRSRSRAVFENPKQRKRGVVVVKQPSIMPEFIDDGSEISCFEESDDELEGVLDSPTREQNFRSRQRRKSSITDISQFLSAGVMHSVAGNPELAIQPYKKVSLELRLIC
jgi:hypothetical protein